LDQNGDNNLPTGKINTVDNTKWDLRNWTKLGDKIKVNGEWPNEGYDNYFIVDHSNEMKHLVS
jgi:hypothetical protein